jgi:hypothetical protein
MPTKDLKNGAVKTTPARRKHKPTFDVPDVAGEPGAPAGWVYREGAASSTQGSAVTRFADVPVGAQETARPAPRSNRLLSTGIGLLFAGAAPIAFVSFLAIGCLAAPFALAKGAITS